jgi:pSer/pThr/pTyr-binding forkhead associated (FHA) protein
MCIVYLMSLPEADAGANSPFTIPIHHFPCLVGRHSSCDRRVDDPTVSRRHCTFSLKEGRVWVEDLGSLNGTRLNGEPVDSRPIADGDKLELGQRHFLVRVPEEPVGSIHTQDTTASSGEFIIEPLPT